MAKARVSQYVVEVLTPTGAYNPTTITGAGVSQYVVEVLIVSTGVKARVSQYVVEVLMVESETQSDPPNTTRSFGYAG